MSKTTRQPAPAPGSATVKLVCPSCRRAYELAEAEVKQHPPICRHCDVLLLRDECDRQGLKCFDCIHSASTPEGLWCKRFGDIADSEMAETCQEYVRVANNSRRRRKGRT